MAIRWKTTGTDRKKKQTVPGGATVQIGDIRQGAELPVEKPSYQLMGAQQPAAAQRASAQALANDLYHLSHGSVHCSS